MTIEVTPEERFVLMSAIKSLQYDNAKFIEDFPNSELNEWFSEQNKISDTIYEKIFNAAFD